METCTGNESKEKNYILICGIENTKKKIRVLECFGLVLNRIKMIQSTRKDAVKKIK